MVFNVFLITVVLFCGLYGNDEQKEFVNFMSLHACGSCGGT